MPKKRLAWASWNYRVTNRDATTHYWMNALQGVSRKRDYFVSLNTDIPSDKVLYETTYEHPIFTLDAIRAQADLPSLNKRSPSQRIFFGGSYFKYGFHEDAYTAGLRAAEAIRPLVSKYASA
jgi:predicted NAD/FAD-binding protein